MEDEQETSSPPDGTGEISTHHQSRLHQYERLIETLPYPVFVMDRHGYLTFANRRFARQFGHEISDDTQVHIADILVDDDLDPVINLLQEMTTHLQDPEEDFRRRIEFDAVTQAGRTRTFEASIAPLVQDGSFDGGAALLRDITLRKRREDVFTVMDRALRHNLRTNVEIITNYVGHLQEETSSEYDDILQRVQDAAEWIYKLGDSLRTIQTAVDESHGSDATASIESIVQEAVEAGQPAENPAEISVQIIAEGELDAGGPIEYALENLVENAIVHNDADPPSVQVLATHAPEDGWIEIHVADNGPGIPEFERDIILRNASVDQLQHGSGLGLWITRWAVEMADGVLDIEENDPRGSVVTLRVPVTNRER